MWNLVGNPEDRLAHNKAHMFFYLSFVYDIAQGGHELWKTGKTGKMMEKNSLQGKIREFRKKAENQEKIREFIF